MPELTDRKAAAYDYLLANGWITRGLDGQWMPAPYGWTRALFGDDLLDAIEADVEEHRKVNV